MKAYSRYEQDCRRSLALAVGAMLALGGCALDTAPRASERGEPDVYVVAATTADNFMRSAPLALTAWLIALALAGVHGSTRGVLLASASGALASGGGYCLWYAALPALSRTTAAVVLLAVPVLAALGGVIVLGEALSTRLLVAGAVILAGVALAPRTR